MLAFDIKLPDYPDTEAGRIALAEDCYEILNGLARINARWVLRQWERGVIPKCCARCGGVKYDSRPRLTDTIRFECSPVILQTKVANCGSIAACHTGHKIAEAVKGKLPTQPMQDPAKVGTKPAISWDDAIARFTVQMKLRPDPAVPNLLHAVSNDDDFMVDGTEGMVKYR
ncbi:MAG TPA: hypothetical protein VF183_14550 [Acidimicrobiales bacterium]